MTTQAAPLARWRLAQPVKPSDSRLRLEVLEVQCASGQNAAGRIECEVEYGLETLTLTVRVRLRSDSETCPGNPWTPYTLDLASPLGERRLADGGGFRPLR